MKGTFEMDNFLAYSSGFLFFSSLFTFFYMFSYGMDFDFLDQLMGGDKAESINKTIHVSNVWWGKSRGLLLKYWVKLQGFNKFN